MNQLIFFLMIFVSSLYAEYEESEFGLGAWIRTSNIVYEHDASVDNSIRSFIPLFYFDSEYLFLNGSEGGIKLYEHEHYRISALTRLEFNDIPTDLQNKIQEDHFNYGIQTSYEFDDESKLYLELMSAKNFNLYVNTRYEKEFKFEDLELRPSAQLKLKSSGFNSYYYGINEDFIPDSKSLGAGIEPSLALDLKYKLFSDLYLLAKAKFSYIDASARKNPLVSSSHKQELYFGVSLFNDVSKPKKKILKAKEYIRLAYGLATPSNLGDISNIDAQKDEFENSLTSIFYGYPLADTLFGLSIESYLSGGLVHHFSSEVQNSSTEGIFAIKGYYTIPLPIRFRLGVAEGLSYVDNVTYIEGTELEDKDKKNSELMNYLDFSFDVNLADIISKEVEGLWFGYSIHHRSSIFESSSQFGRIKGGSNYQTLYLQYHF